MGVKVKVIKGNDSVILEIRGRISGSDAIMISKKLETYISQPITRVALDLSFLDYLDSTWLGTFIYCMGLYKDNHKELVFIIPDGFILELFNNSNISSIAKIYKTREDFA